MILLAGLSKRLAREITTALELPHGPRGHHETLTAAVCKMADWCSIGQVHDFASNHVRKLHVVVVVAAILGWIRCSAGQVHDFALMI